MSLPFPQMATWTAKAREDRSLSFQQDEMMSLRDPWTKDLMPRINQREASSVRKGRGIKHILE